MYTTSPLLLYLTIDLVAGCMNVIVQSIHNTDRDLALIVVIEEKAICR